MNNNQSAKKITIIGIGNTLYGDEGVGVHTLPLIEEEFANDEMIEIIEGSTDGLMLLGHVEDAEHLIVIDAINAGKSGGTIITLEGEEIPAYYGVKVSVHQLGFQEVLWAAKFRERYPKNIIMFGMQPSTMGLGLELSKTNQAQLQELASKVIEQVNAWRRVF